MSTRTPYLFAGAYTRLEPHLTNAQGKGLYVFRFDPLTGGLAFASATPGIDNPFYLAIDPQNRFLYAVSEVWDWPEGRISAYAIDPVTGGLTYLNGQSSRGWLAVHTSVDKTGRWLAVANYMAGNVVLMPLHADGQVGGAAERADRRQDAAQLCHRPQRRLSVGGQSGQRHHCQLPDRPTDGRADGDGERDAVPHTGLPQVRGALSTNKVEPVTVEGRSSSSALP